MAIGCDGCRAAAKRVRAAQIVANVHELRGGRWVLATWNARDAQWTSHDIDAAQRRAGFQGAFARKLEALPGAGVKTYARRAGAIRALGPPTPDGFEDLCPAHARELSAALQRESDERYARELEAAARDEAAERERNRRAGWGT